MGEPCEPPCLFLWKQFPQHLQSTFGILTVHLIHKLQSPIFQTLILGGLFAPLFYSPMDIPGMMRNLESLLPQRNQDEGNRAAQSSQALWCFFIFGATDKTEN